MSSLRGRIKNKLISFFSSTEKIKERENILELQNFGFDIFEVTEEYLVIWMNNQKIRLRKRSSDYAVFKQVFITKEYEPIISFFRNNQMEISQVIDAGSNIGLTTLFIKWIFPTTKIYCIEPDPENIQLLQYNLNEVSKNDSVYIYKAGLLGQSKLNLNIGKDFRGGGNWARQTILSESETGLKSITVNDIIHQRSISTIDLLKIDIEGAETFLLEKDTDLSFLNLTKAIAIEIHDEYNCRGGIYEILLKYDFLLLDIGETTFALNKKYF